MNLKHDKLVGVTGTVLDHCGVIQVHSIIFQIIPTCGLFGLTPCEMFMTSGGVRKRQAA